MPEPRRARRIAAILGLVALATAPALATAIPATAAPVAPAAVHRGPTDQVSFSLPALQPDFGYQKQGTILRRSIDILNDGIDSITIDSAPLTALAAPFTLKSTTLSSTTVIAPGARGSFLVEYTAPSAGTDSLQTITLTATDHDRPGTYSQSISFIGHSLSTPRAYFELINPAGSATLDLGSVKAGTSVTKTITIQVFGIDPLEFDQRNITVTTSDPAARVTVVNAVFGNGAIYRPGSSPTFDVTFTPGTAGAFSGSLRVIADVRNGDPETAPVDDVMPFVANVTPGRAWPNPPG